MGTVLGPDMLTIVEGPVFVAPGEPYSHDTSFDGHAFFEGPSIRKKDGKYYFIFSTQLFHELGYAVSDDPLKGFEYKGVLVSNGDLNIDTYKPADKPMFYCANNHGSMVQIGDDWYIFYHRHTNNTWFSRQGCAEKLKLNPDGSFDQAEITSCGLNGGPLEGKGEYPAYIACHLYNEKKHTLYLGEANLPKIVQDGRDGDEEVGYIANMTDGDTAGFKYFDFKDVKRISIDTRGYCDGKFEVRTSWDGEVLAEIDILSSNVWETWSADVKIPDGVGSLYLTYRGGSTAMLRSFTLE